MSWTVRPSGLWWLLCGVGFHCSLSMSSGICHPSHTCYMSFVTRGPRPSACLLLKCLFFRKKGKGQCTGFCFQSGQWRTRDRMRVDGDSELQLWTVVTCGKSCALKKGYGRQGKGEGKGRALHFASRRCTNSSVGCTMIFSRRIERKGLHCIVLALQSRRFDCTVQAGYPPPLTKWSAMSSTGETHKDDIGVFAKILPILGLGF